MTASSATSPRGRAFVRVALLVAVEYFVHSGARNVAATVSSDSLYLTALLRDIFVRGVPLSAWHTQPAPALFPDAPIFGLLLLVARGPVLAIYLWGTLTLWLLGLATARVARETGLTKERALLAGVLTTFILALLALRERQLGNVLFPAHHGAGVVVGLFLAAETLRLVHVGSWRRFTAVALIAMLTAAFDSSALIHGFGPSLAALFVASLARAPHARRALALLALLAALAQPFGRWCLRRLAFQVIPPEYELSLSWGAMVKTYRLLPGASSYLPAMRTITALWLLVVTGSLVLVVLALRDRAFRQRGLVLGALGLSATVGVFVCIAATGLVVGEWLVRYLLSGWVFPVTFFCIGALSLDRRRLAIFAGVLGVLGALAFAFVTKASLESTPLVDADLDPQPEPTLCVASFMHAHGATGGFASYWVARRVSETAEPPVSLVPVHGYRAPAVWIANDRALAWMPAPGEPFVVVPQGIQSEELFARYREIARTTCPIIDDVVLLENTAPPSGTGLEAPDPRREDP